MQINGKQQRTGVLCCFNTALVWSAGPSEIFVWRTRLVVVEPTTNSRQWNTKMFC